MAVECGEEPPGESVGPETGGRAAGVQILHATPGRIRLRLSALRGNAELAEQLQGGLGLVPGILAAEASPITGSLLLVYDPGRYASPADLLALGRAVPGLLDGVDVDALLRQATESQSGAGALDPAAILAPINAWAAQAMGGVDLRLLVPLGLFALGLRSLIVSERTLPAWYDFFWFGFGTYMMLKRDGTPPATPAGAAAGTAPESPVTP